ncbi:MAG: hypothetical protein VX346_11110 [Planctomycetota bacterium]|nr:hypothetical protein [Planctomycetota bacterium]
MSFLRRAFAPFIVGVMLFAGLLSAMDPRAPTTPTLLVLRNGQILRGSVTQVGDYYLVIIGPSSQVRVPADQVDYACHSLEQVYRSKVANTRLATAREHLKLAEWCLHYQLRSRAADHLLTAIAINPNEPTIPRIQRFWTASTQAPTKPRPAVAVAPSISSHKEVEAALRTLPRKSVERFTHKVQPLLLNYCSNSNCHGPNSESSFRLVRPLFAKRMTRRFTQRNLHTILQYIDRISPQESQLLIIPKQPHGNLSTPVFGNRQELQYQTLEQWVTKLSPKITAATPPPHVAPPPHAVLTKPADFQETAKDPKSNDEDSLLDELVNTLTEEDGGKTPVQSPKRRRQFVPRDPFDPQIFNRRYFAEEAP